MSAPNKNEKDAVALAVQSKDAKKDDKKKPKGKGAGKDGDEDAPKTDDLSEEDQRIIAEVELLVARSQDKDSGIACTALQQLSTMLRIATGTVASIPKPLKFIRPHFAALREHAAALPRGAPQRKATYDVLALVAMTLELPNEPHAALALKLEGTHDDLAKWGHEFLRHLAGDLAALYAQREEEDKPVAELLPMVDQALAYMMSHQDEPSACDLALEVEMLPALLKHTDASTYAQVSQYLVATARYLVSPEDTVVLDAAFDLYMRFEGYTQALCLAIQTRDTAKAKAVFAACSDDAVTKQLALLAGRTRTFIETGDEPTDEIIGNNGISGFFRHCGKELDSLAVKTPEELYKEHLLEKTAIPTNANSYMHNMINCLVSGFANAGFGEDKLVTADGSAAIHQTKDHRKMTAAAAIGLIHLWDVDAGLAAADKLTYAEDDAVKGGALMSIGLVLCGVRSPFDPAMGLLAEHVESTVREVRVGAILGLGFAYAGMFRDDVQELLVPLLADPSQPLEVQCIAAYALALVFCGSGNADISEATTMCLMDKSPALLGEPCVRYLVLALGLLFMGKQDAADSLLEATAAMPEEVAKYAEVTIIACAYAGTCNVMMVQKLFSIAAEKLETPVEGDDEDKPADNKAGGSSTTAAAAAAAAPAADEDAPKEKDETDEKEGKEGKEGKAKKWNHKAAATMGVGLIAMGEDLGAAMAKRALLHTLLSKEDSSTSGRRGVPLALALLCVSDPQMPVVENLSKLSHDSDVPTAQAATVGLGLVSAGTNNARASTLLRNLCAYYAKDRDQNHLLSVRLAQALCAMGRGHITLSPRQLDGQSLSNVALAGVLTLCHSALDVPSTFFGKHHYMAYAAACAATPRLLLAVDEKLEPVATQFRVGIAVDTVAVPGKPKTITGFQTHQSPVLSNVGERAELVPGKHRALSVLEGVCIVREKPDLGETA